MVAPRRGAPGLVLLVLVSLVGCTGPFRREPHEPARTWFRAYSGPMLPSSVTCGRNRRSPKYRRVNAMSGIVAGVLTGLFGSQGNSSMAFWDEVRWPWTTA